jgi:hypothetical protein
MAPSVVDCAKSSVPLIASSNATMSGRADLTMLDIVPSLLSEGA